MMEQVGEVAFAIRIMYSRERLILRQLLHGNVELEFFGKKLSGARQHQLVRLTNRYIRHAGDIGDFFLRSRITGGLRGHINGRSRHRDGRSTRDNIQIHGRLGDVRGGSLNIARQAQSAAEPIHEIARRDDIHVGIVVSLEDQFETTPNLLLAHRRHGHDLLESPRHALLTTSDVQTGRRNGLVRSTPQIPAFVDRFEKIISPFRDGARQIDAVTHAGNDLDGVQQGSIRAGHGASIGVHGVAIRIEGGLARGGADHGGEVAAAEQVVLGSTHTRSILAAFLVGEGPPFGAHVNHAIAHHQTALGADHVARPMVLDQIRVRMLRTNHFRRHGHGQPEHGQEGPTADSRQKMKGRGRGRDGALKKRDPVAKNTDSKRQRETETETEVFGCS